MAKKKKDIDLENQRYGLFVDENSYNLEIEYGRHYLETDVNFFVELFKVNIIETKANSLYGQAKSRDKKYLAPVKLTAMVNIDDVEQSNYGNNEGGIVRQDTGNIRVGIYLEELQEKRVEIDRGDIIKYNQSGHQPRYYEVDNAKTVIDSTENTIGGFRPYFKLITGVPIKEDITPFLFGENLK